ncbi:MAG: alanine racemase [Solirubrobacteraceae bacterium]
MQPDKLAVVAELARQHRITVTVDDLRNVEQLSRAAAEATSRLEVLIELDVGMGRCGVRQLGDSPRAGLSTLAALDGPLQAGCEDIQDDWKSVISDIVGYMLAGEGLDPDRLVVKMPPILMRDVQPTSSMLISAMAAFDPNGSNRDLQRWVMAQILELIGDPDPQAVLDQILPPGYQTPYQQRQEEMILGVGTPAVAQSFERGQIAQAGKATFEQSRPRGSALVTVRCGGSQGAARRSRRGLEVVQNAWYTMTGRRPAPRSPSWRATSSGAFDRTGRWRSRSPEARGDCQQILSSMRPKVEVHSGVDCSRPSYVFVLHGTFPSHLPTDAPRRAAAAVIDADSQRAVSSDGARLVGHLVAEAAAVSEYLGERLRDLASVLLLGQAVLLPARVHAEKRAIGWVGG